MSSHIDIHNLIHIIETNDVDFLYKSNITLTVVFSEKFQ